MNMSKNKSVFALQQAFNPSDEEVEDLYCRYTKGELTMSEFKEATANLLIKVII